MSPKHTFLLADSLDVSIFHCFVVVLNVTLFFFFRNKDRPFKNVLKNKIWLNSSFFLKELYLYNSPPPSPKNSRYRSTASSKSGVVQDLIFIFVAFLCLAVVKLLLVLILIWYRMSRRIEGKKKNIFERAWSKKLLSIFTRLLIAIN